MPTRITRTPQHRLDTPSDGPTPRHTTLRRALRHGLVAAAAVAVTGATLGAVAYSEGGLANAGDAAESASAGAALSEVTSDENLEERLTDRGESASRSDRRDQTDAAKAAALAPGESQAVTRSVKIEPKEQDPKTLARSMMGEFGFASSEFSCLEQLWEKESGWDPNAANPTSSAYGIPQALPGSKMSSAGGDWENNPATQIRWGLGYIDDRYGSPCSAWSHSQANNWY